MIENKGEIVIYQTPDGTIQTEVRMEAETLWLNLNQISDLFGRDKSTISRHIKKIYLEGELEEPATVALFATVQIEGDRPISRQIEFYNLDMILSVGYRVNSKRGTQFRIWANRILKEHLVQGYTINQKRLTEQRDNILKLRESIQLVERSLLEQAETINDARKIVKILADFAKGLDILDDYDHENLEHKGKTEQSAIVIETAEFLSVVEAMRRDFDSAVFGQPKDNSFDSSVGQIYQSFAGKELYPSIEHKAAMLLYLVVKNHSFFSQSGRRIISDEGLAALTLLIAVSKPEEKDTMVNIVITILNRSRS
ncbi:RhuM family protein [Treponema sp.]